MNNDITAILLAGGKGRRLGGKDKGLTIFKSKPLIEYAIKLASVQTPNIIISANRNHSAYESYNYPVYADQTNTFDGPLSGISTCLQHVRTPYTFVLACDIPHCPKNIIDILMNCMLESNADSCMVIDGKREQPLVSIFDTRLKANLETYLANGHRKTLSWFLSTNHCFYVYKNAENAFDNINRIEQLES